MNPEIKAKWLKALRSGEYKQGWGRLHSFDTFCCLGVLCELHRRETGGEWDSRNPNRQLYEWDNQTLPSVVRDWSGLHDPNPIIAGFALAEHNDGPDDAAPRTFPEIADLIEKHL